LASNLAWDKAHMMGWRDVGVIRNVGRTVSASDLVAGDFACA
jgi:hypothetical protein